MAQTLCWYTLFHCRIGPKQTLFPVLPGNPLRDDAGLHENLGLPPKYLTLSDLHHHEHSATPIPHALIPAIGVSLSTLRS
jgi:hypothetical protein